MLIVKAFKPSAETNQLSESAGENPRIRIWECPWCHAVHDRDTNAGINILKKDCSCSRHKDKKTVPQGMREQYKDSLWTPCKTLQYRKVFANAMVEETESPLL